MKLALRAALARLLQALGRLSERDRLALLLAGLSLAGAAEWFFVWPMHSQRGHIVDAVRAEAQGVSDAARQAEQALRQAHAEQQARAAALDADLAQLGMAQVSGHKLGELVARTLKPQAVRVVTLRELAVEEFQVSAAAPAGAALALPEGAPAAPAPRPLYRHRFELRLAGEVPALLAAVAALEREVRPLRTERLRMASSDGRAVELTLAFVVVGTERVWLTL
ncbi:MAG: hypothetical protein Q8K96_11655 [Rubrivivax sp.]|nr:hypothetical protein [Rubrivivax sp.]